MTDSAGRSSGGLEPLARLRLRVREALDHGDEAVLERWRAELAGDGRAGARGLAASCQRRLEAMAAERLRIGQLCERRKKLRESGLRWIAGVDEVGVGPLAGPVVAAAVVLPDQIDLPGLNDSKKVTAPRREELSVAIREQADAFAIGEVPPREIDRLNILQASLEAMRRAVVALPENRTPDHILVDARTIPGVDFPQTALIHGDAIDASIAAASIVAKVYRDAIMHDLDVAYPQYGFRKNMGYPTPDHLAALREYGPCPMHRRSFGPVQSSLRGSGSS